MLAVGHDFGCAKSAVIKAEGYIYSSPALLAFQSGRPLLDTEHCLENIHYGQVSFLGNSPGNQHLKLAVHFDRPSPSGLFSPALSPGPGTLGCTGLQLGIEKLRI